MLLSRWKLMAAVLGLSLGGLAAVTGQCPKDTTKTSRRAETPPEFEIPKTPAVPSAGSPAPKLPPAPTAPATPALPLPAPPASALPDLPPAPAPEVSTPTLPPAPAKVSEPKPTLPPAPVSSPVIPASGTDTKPPLPAAETVANPTPPVGKLTPPTVSLPDPGSSAKVNPPAVEPSPVKNPPPVPAADPVIEPKPELKPEVKPVPAAAPGANKYRILLRVGEGEPTFEVKAGDDLILKVVCEKIDIKSPEKGNGLSAVKASGKVRFVGFGAEGTCEELSFLAGTGEVSLSGAVKVQVKDKLGRVESELSTETMKYRIDPSAAFSGGKP
ncbi:MAG: hypothetical protein U0792_09320 [Gemmataceae bacterium]